MTIPILERIGACGAEATLRASLTRTVEELTHLNIRLTKLTQTSAELTLMAIKLKLIDILTN